MIIKRFVITSFTVSCTFKTKSASAAFVCYLPLRCRSTLYLALLWSKKNGKIMTSLRETLWIWPLAMALTRYKSVSTGVNKHKKTNFIKVQRPSYLTAETVLWEASILGFILVLPHIFSFSCSGFYTNICHSFYINFFVRLFLTFEIVCQQSSVRYLTANPNLKDDCWPYG